MWEILSHLETKLNGHLFMGVERCCHLCVGSVLPSFLKPISYIGKHPFLSLTCGAMSHHWMNKPLNSYCDSCVKIIKVEIHVTWFVYFHLYLLSVFVSYHCVSWVAHNGFEVEPNINQTLVLGFRSSKFQV